MSAPEPADDHAAGSGTLGSWLRAQRLARKWAVAELARQLCKAAKASGDHTIVSASIMASYVRRWERDMIAPTERYRLHYCAVLGLAPVQFGPAPAPHPATHRSGSAGPPSMHDADDGNVVVVIPDDRLQVIIHIHRSAQPPGSRSQTLESGHVERSGVHVECDGPAAGCV